MNKKIIEEKYVLEYIKDMINDYGIKLVEVNNAKYHHNTSYKNVLHRSKSVYVKNIDKYGYCTPHYSGKYNKYTS